MAFNDIQFIDYKIVHK